MSAVTPAILVSARLGVKGAAIYMLGVSSLHLHGHLKIKSKLFPMATDCILNTVEHS